MDFFSLPPAQILRVPAVALRTLGTLARERLPAAANQIWLRRELPGITMVVLRAHQVAPSGGAGGGGVQLEHEAHEAAAVVLAQPGTGTPLSPEAARTVANIQGWMVSQGIPLDAHLIYEIQPDAQMALAGPTTLARSMRGGIQMRQVLADALPVLTAPGIRGAILNRAALEAAKDLIHEMLHQIRDVERLGSAQTFSKVPREGLTEAVAQDMLPGLVKHLTGTRNKLRAPIVYKDQVVQVRRKSAQITGRPWTSTVATRWRRRLIFANERDRVSMWDGGKS